MPRTKRFHALKRPKLRQDWSKWNLYNLTRVTTPPASQKTFFQQKWAAKSMLRSYHNPDVREGTWTRMFDRRLPAVVPMDHRYLAKEDGSEMAKGRGMGVEKRPVAEEADRRGRNQFARARNPERTPYMHMTFHPLERRLDTSIFRALFASSTRQARQFVVHGFVKVNGKKMKYPGYQLNPGDMFSVEPEMVLFATGARKVKKDDNRSNLEIERAYLRRLEREEETKEGRSRRRQQEAEEAREEDIEAETEAELADGGESGVATAGSRSSYSTELRSLMKRAKVILADSKRDLSGKSKIELRNFTRQVKAVFSKLNKTEDSKTAETLEGLETTLAEILTKVSQDAVPDTPATTNAAAASSEQPTESTKPNANAARKDAELLHAALLRARANPIDESKPYATPWEPREFMSAFAFIPRYLEVNQNICSAVYLRHPVARPGLAEVPTPFSAETMALGFNWYLRRR